MLRKGEKTKVSAFMKSEGLSKKIVSKMALIVAVIFLLTIFMSALLSASELIQVNREKLTSVAYENAFLVANDIENAYGKVVGFAGSLRNISSLDPKEQRDAIDTALVGVLEGGDGFPTAFAYFEQNVIADADGVPYSVHKKIWLMRRSSIRMKKRRDIFLKSMKMLLTIMIKSTGSRLSRAENHISWTLTCMS